MIRIILATLLYSLICLGKVIICQLSYSFYRVLEKTNLSNMLVSLVCRSNLNNDKRSYGILQLPKE